MIVFDLSVVNQSFTIGLKRKVIQQQGSYSANVSTEFQADACATGTHLTNCSTSFVGSIVCIPLGCVTSEVLSRIHEFTLRLYAAATMC